MANEITIDATLQYDDGVSAPVSMDIADFLATIGVSVIHRGQQIVTTSEAALNLGTLASIGYCIIKSLDATNYMHVRPATAGLKTIKILPGGLALFYMGDDATAPFVISNSGNVKIDFLLCSR